jgi:transcriptional regulator with XRE-family HTH domain
MNEIGERIKKLRHSLGLKQVQFAQQVRVSQGYLAEVEKGKKIPSSRVLLAVSTVFAIDEDWLRTGRGRKNRPEDMQLSKEEREVVSMYRRLRPAQQTAFMKRIKSGTV